MRHKEIALSKKSIKHHGYVAKVDAEDLDYLKKFNWSVSFQGAKGYERPYAVRFASKDGKAVKVSMHRELMGLPSLKLDDRVVDHNNGDSLDNRKVNLIVCTQHENMLNSNFKKKKVEPWL